MGFDINSVMKDMLAAAESVILHEWPKMKDCLERVLADEKDALERITNAYISGGINEEELKEQLDSERDVLEAGVAMVRVCSKATIQRAVNAALGVLADAVKAVV